MLCYLTFHLVCGFMKFKEECHFDKNLAIFLIKDSFFRFFFFRYFGANTYFVFWGFSCNGVGITLCSRSTVIHCLLTQLEARNTELYIIYTIRNIERKKLTSYKVFKAAIPFYLFNLNIIFFELHNQYSCHAMPCHAILTFSICKR